MVLAALGGEAAAGGAAAEALTAYALNHFSIHSCVPRGFSRSMSSNIFSNTPGRWWRAA